jgi:hypothetical protein
MNNFGLWHWLVVGAVLYFVLRPLLKAGHGSRTTTSSAAAPSKVRVGTIPHHWVWKNEYEFEVVGESNYQAVLRQLAGDHGSEPANAEHVAALTLDDENPHDAKAVAVKIGGRLVGYLSREDARSFRRRLSQRGLARQDTTCNAMIVGGWANRAGERAYYGVKLDMKPFE